MFSSRCYNGGNKHKFQPRYSEYNGPIEGLKEVKEEQTFWLRGISAQKKQYKGDVCVWCGKVINDK